VTERVDADRQDTLPRYWSFLGDVYVYQGKAKIPFEEGMESAYIGKTYEANARTWPSELSSKYGTQQGSKRHFNRVFARCVNDSAYPIINGYRPEPENPRRNVLDSTTSDDIEVRNEGTLEQGVITIKQDLPLSTEIAGIFGKQTVGVT